MDLPGREQGPMADSSESGNEYSCFMKDGGELLYQLGGC